MIDPVNVGSSVVANHLTQAMDDMHSEECKRAGRRSEFWDFLEKLDEIAAHTKAYIDLHTRAITPDEWYSTTLYPDPLSYIVPHYERSHFCMFLPSSTSITFKIPQMGSYTKTLNAGWNQIDLPEGTEIVSGDTNQHKVAIVFCDDVRGTAI